MGPLKGCVAQCGYLDPRSSRFGVRSFESPNSEPEAWGLDPKSEVRPEALGAWFGRFDYSGRGFPIVGPLPHFYIDRTHINSIYYIFSIPMLPTIVK
jgi:hypothetical protein